jgi:hypothetical protein
MRYTSFIAGGFGFACCDRVAIQPKTIFGYGTEILVGSSNQALFVAPDFSSPVTRLFAGPDVLPPFFDPIAESTSRVVVEGPRPEESRTLVRDTLVIGSVQVEDVVMSLESERMKVDKPHRLDSAGRLGLGPTSAIALTHSIKVQPETIEYPNGNHRLGYSLELLDSVEESAQIMEFNIDHTANGWISPGTLMSVGDELITYSLIEFDPMVDEIEVPRFAVSTLIEVLPESVVKEDGIIYTRCSEVMLPIELVSPTGSHSLYVVGTGAESSAGEELCPTGFRRSRFAESSTWKVNPLKLAGAKSVLLSAESGRVIVQTEPSENEQRGPIPSVASPRVPLYSKIDVKWSGEVVTVTLVASDEDSEMLHPAQFALASLSPVKMDNDKYIYAFIRGRRALPVVPTNQLVGTNLELSDLEVLENQNLRLRCRRVEHGTHGTYRLSLMHSTQFMAIVFSEESF